MAGYRHCYSFRVPILNVQTDHHADLIQGYSPRPVLSGPSYLRVSPSMTTTGPCASAWINDYIGLVCVIRRDRVLRPRSLPHSIVPPLLLISIVSRKLQFRRARMYNVLCEHSCGIYSRRNVVSSLWMSKPIFEMKTSCTNVDIRRTKRPALEKE
jgi:hypothetical protein